MSPRYRILDPELAGGAIAPMAWNVTDVRRNAQQGGTGMLCTTTTGLRRIAQPDAASPTQTTHALPGIQPALALQPVLIGPDRSTSTRHLGRRRYELTDHLGNVRSVVGDRKLSDFSLDINTPVLVPTSFKADVLSYADYDSFGSLLPGRNYSSDAYRFGFNGQEKVDEVNGSTGTHNTALFWEYDTRTGRRWNLDPKPNASVSSYAAFSLNPIFYSDPLGDTVKYSGFKERIDVFFAKLGSKAFRSEFKSLKESKDVFTYKKGDATKNRGGWVSLDALNTSEEGFISNAEFTIHYGKPNKDERAAPYGLSKKHGLFEETFHATDYLAAMAGRAVSGIGILPDPEVGGFSLGWETPSQRITGESLAWKFAADNAPGVRTSGRFPLYGAGGQVVDRLYTDRTLMRMIRETDVKDSGTIGRLLFTQVPIPFTSTTSGAQGETLIGPLYNR